MKTIEKATIDLSLFTHVNMRQQKVAAQLLEIVYHQGKEIAPEMFDNRGRWVLVDPRDYEVLVKQWEHFTNVLMHRKSRYESELAISMSFAASGSFNTLNLWVEEEYFESPSRITAFLEMSTAIYNLLHPAYGRVHQTQDAIEMATVPDPKYGKTVFPVDLRKGLPGIFWANFFGPEYVKAIGKHKFLSAPNVNVIELLDGGVIALTGSSPLDPFLKLNREKRRAIENHLGTNFFQKLG